MKASWFLLVPVIFPMIGLALIVGARKRHAALKRSVSIAVALVVLLINASLARGITRGYNYFLPPFRVNSFLQLYLKLDGLGMVFACTASVLWVFVTVYSFGYMRGHGRQLRYFSFLTVCLGITMGIAYSGNLFTLYIFYELLTLATYPLVVHKEDKKAMDAGKKYLVYSFSGAALILVGMILFYAATGTLNFLPGGMDVYGLVEGEEGIILFSFTLFFIGFGVKAAVVPLHSWLPAAMAAPTPVSALFHAVAVVKAGVFSLARVIYYLFGPGVVREFNKPFLYMVCFTILYGSVLALGQDNLKRRLAYSTVSQLSYILLGLLMVNPNGYTGGIMHLVNHALIKIVLFLCTGCVMSVTGKTRVSQLKGVGRSMPFTMTSFAIASVCLVGIPPTNGFASKWYLSMGSLDAGVPVLLTVLLSSALLTAAYLFPVVGIAFFTEDEEEPARKGEAPAAMLIPVIMLTLITVISGVCANRLVQAVGSNAKYLFD